MMNLGMVEARKTLRTTVGAGASMSIEAMANLLESAGGDPATVSRMRIEGAKAAIRREAGGRFR